MDKELLRMLMEILTLVLGLMANVKEEYVDFSFHVSVVVPLWGIDSWYVREN